MGDAFIPNDWDGETYCCYSVKWPKSFEWLSVLNGLIDWAGTGFYYDERTGTVTDAIAAIRPTWEYNFKNEEVIMTCNQEGNAILERIALALEGMNNVSNCCGGISGVNGGSSGSGMEPANPSDVIDDGTSHLGPPPPGFDTWGQFAIHKCDWANYILDQMAIDIATMGAIQVLTQSATALAAILIPLLVTPVGWVVLLEIAIVMIAAATTSTFYGFVSTHLEAYRDDYICALVTGSDVSSSIANFGAMVDEKIAEDSNFNTLTGYWATSILKSIASVDSINRLYTEQALSIPSGECDACAGWIFFFTFAKCTPTFSDGAGHLYNGIPIEVTSCNGNTFGDVRAVCEATATSPETTNRRLTFTVIDSGSADFYLTPYDEGTVQSGIPLTPAELDGYEIECTGFNLTRLTVSDTTPFTITVMAEEI